MDFSLLCKHLYKNFRMPFYLYQDKTMVAAYPDFFRSFPLPHPILLEFRQMDAPTCMYVTQQFSYFGRVQAAGTPYSIVFGPCRQVPYDQPTVDRILREYIVLQDQAEIFTDVICSIPKQSRHSFAELVRMVHFIVNEEEIAIDAIPGANLLLDAEPTVPDFTKELITDKEESRLLHSNEIENALLHAVETGNLKALMQHQSRESGASVGHIALDGLRQAKNLAITVTALVSRTAIRAGLDPLLCHELAGSYMRETERRQSPQSISLLIRDMQIDFTKRVAENQIALPENNLWQQILQYIRSNTNRPITVQDIADHVGYSRSYLSHHFKEETGVDLSKVIMRCRLEDAKELLAYSDRSLSEISNFLCFANQSHFQRSFKALYGMTPMEYRITKGGVNG